MKSKVKVKRYQERIGIKSGIPFKWRINFKRYIWLDNFDKDEKRKTYQERKFGEIYSGNYKYKRVIRVLHKIYYLNERRFLNNKDKWLEKLVSIEKYLRYFYKKSLVSENIKDGEIRGKDYNDYNSWNSIFWTLSYVSDKWNCVTRLIWLLDLIELYKNGKLSDISLKSED